MKLFARIDVLERKLAVSSEWDKEAPQDRAYPAFGVIDEHPSRPGILVIDFGDDTFYMLDKGDVSKHGANIGEKWEVDIKHPHDQYAKLVKKHLRTSTVNYEEKYEHAFEIATELMRQAEESGVLSEPTSAYKAAAHEVGIPYGKEMEAFVTWARLKN